MSWVCLCPSVRPSVSLPELSLSVLCVVCRSVGCVRLFFEVKQRFTGEVMDSDGGVRCTYTRERVGLGELKFERAARDIVY